MIIELETSLEIRHHLKRALSHTHTHTHTQKKKKINESEREREREREIVFH